MPKRTNSKKPTATATHLRRSPRLLHLKPQAPNTTNNPRLKTNSRKPSIKSIEPGKKAIASAIPQVEVVSGLRRSPRLSLLVTHNLSGLRRSPRLSLLVTHNPDRSKNSSSSSESVKISSPRKKTTTQVRNKSNGNKRVPKCSARRSCSGVEVVVEEERGGIEDACEKGEGFGAGRKRKRGEDDNGGSVQGGWTKEQETALQRAYFSAKPTPLFWKKVSKMVPGKSSQDCFNKIHADYMTPIQPLPRSRAKYMKSSPLGCFSLSASKVLNVSGTNIKKLYRNKQKGYLVQKTVRHLLQKQSCLNQDYEADLFSVLEPGMNQCTRTPLGNDELSTPKQLKEQEFLQKCSERSSSRHKRSLSRFSLANEVDLVSPPVLKHLKSRALHEKYIDQLHIREAKRKAAQARLGMPVTGKENKEQVNGKMVDVVRAAKSALMWDARDAIHQFQQLHSVADDHSLEFDDGNVNDDYDDPESEV